MTRLTFLLFVTLIFLLSSAVSGQDATVAAAKNYKIEFENELVRVVRVTYAPHESSPMHSHQGNASVIVTLKGGGRMHSINEDGSATEGKTEQTGAVRFVPARPAFKHSSENVTDFPVEVIRVELKQAPPCTASPTRDTPVPREDQDTAQ